jgi:ribonucleoside-diphosphate reductase alpha chain
VARVDGRDYASAPQGFFRTATRPVVRVETAEGYTLRLTADHRLRRVTGFVTGTPQSEWCAAGELRAGDRLLLSDHRSASNWAGPHTREQGYLIGLLIGDGALKQDKAVLSVWLPALAVNAREEMAAVGVRAVMNAAFEAAATLPQRVDFTGWHAVAGRGEYRLALGSLRRLALQLGLRPGAKCITPAMERASSDFQRGVLRGLFDTDGSVQGNQTKGVSVRLAQSNVALLEAAQRMLQRLGIASRIYRERRAAGTTLLPDGRGGNAR